MVRTALITVACLLAVVNPARADERVAVVIGDNAGDRSEVVLRYAEDDARRVAQALRAGGFAPENIMLLTDANAGDVRRALGKLRERHALVFVFYSGHGDAESLHLAGTRLPLDELKATISAMPARARIVVLDACRSGGLTRVKGGKAGPSFAIDLEGHDAGGTAMLTSSTANEDAQESDALRASFFTHHFVSALRGAADLDRNGQVSVGEAFHYAAHRTAASTVATVHGPQHPTYRLDLAGRHDVVLTTPGVGGGGRLRVEEPGTWIVQRGDANGPVIVEVTTQDQGRTIALEPGRYTVTWRAHDHLRQGVLVVATGRTTSARQAELRRFEYARVVRKGGTERRFALSMFALGGTRGEVHALGTPMRLRAGARLDTRSLSFELRATAGSSDAVNPRQSTHTREASLALAALHVIDLRGVSVGLGIEAGAGAMAQRFEAPPRQPAMIAQPPDRLSAFGLFAPLVTCDVALGSRVYARVEASSPTYLVRTSAGAAANITWEVGAGIGAFF